MFCYLDFFEVGSDLFCIYLVIFFYILGSIVCYRDKIEIKIDIF